MEQNKNYIVAVDVGSSKVVVAVASMTDVNNMINIEAVVKKETDGVSAGMVENSQSVSKALKAAIEEVEELLDIKISDAYASLSGKFVRSARYTDHVFVEDAERCISKHDLKALHDRMLNVKSPDDEYIMDLYPVEYKNDAGVKLSQPVGAYSKQLSATYNFILCESAAKDRLRRVFLNAGINLKALFASGTIIADSLVSTDEKQEGVAIVDLGRGVTDIAVYYGNVLCHMTSLPIGGEAVTVDIHHFTANIPLATVEKLKRRYSSAIAISKPESMIQIRRSSGSNNIKSISLFNLETVTEARMTELVEYVWKEIRETGLAKKLASGIVLTGGGANMAHVADLFHKVTGLDVRVACAEVGISAEQAHMVEQLDTTLAISLLMRGAKEGPCPVGRKQVVLPPEPEPEPEPELEEIEETDIVTKPEKPGLIGKLTKLLGNKLREAFENPDDDNMEIDDVEKDKDDDF